MSLALKSCVILQTLGINEIQFSSRGKCHIKRLSLYKALERFATPFISVFSKYFVVAFKVLANYRERLFIDFIHIVCIYFN